MVIDICAAIVLFCTGFLTPVVGIASGDILTVEEREWLLEHDGKITLGFLKNVPVYFEKDENGRPVGITVEYIRLLEQRLGFTFQIHERDSWSELVQGLYDGTLDALPGFSYSIDRARKVHISIQYTANPYAIISREGEITEESLAGHIRLSMAVPEKYAVASYLREKYPDLLIREMDTLRSCVLAVAFGEVDFAVGSIAIMSRFIKKYQFDDLYFSPLKKFQNDHRFGVRKDLPILHSILNKGIARITEKEHEAIARKWISLGYEPFYKNKVFWVIVCLFLFFGLLLQGIWFWNRKLRQVVALRTSALEQHTGLLKEEAKILRQTETELVRQESYLNTLFEAIPDLVWLKDSEGNFVSFNTAFSRCFGLAAGNTVGSKTLQFFDEEITAAWYREDLEVINNLPGYIFRGEDKIQMASGLFMQVEVVKTGIFDENDRCTGVLGIARDITRHRQKQDELIKLRQRLEAILGNIKGVIYRIENADGVWKNQYISSYIEVLTGCNPDEFINEGEDFYKEFIHPDDRNEVFRNLQDALRKDTHWEQQYRLVHKDGSVRWVQGRGTRLSDPVTGKTYLDGIVFDISELREIEAQLHQAKKLETIGVLASGLANDFNNILGGILGFTEILQEDMKRLEYPEKIRMRLDYVLLGIKRADELVSQIRQFSEVDKTWARQLRVNVVVKEVSKLLETTSESSIRVTAVLKDDCMIMADATRFHQIMMNLGTNSIHAMRECGGQITITTEQVVLDENELDGDMEPGSYLKLSVADSGHGMDKNVLEKSLQPFFTTKPAGEGTGMGLWLVNQIVRDLNGYLTVDSVVGEGTEVTVFFPVVEKRDGEDDSQLEQEDLKQYAGNECILYVDDEKTLTDVAELVLAGYGYKVRAYNSSVEALHEFSANPDEYDLVITDLSMPGISGEQFRQRITGLRPEIKVILTTGFQKEGQELSEFDRTLGKPVSIVELLKTVREVLG